MVVCSNGLLRANKNQLLPDGDFTAFLANLLKCFATLIVVFVDFFLFIIHLELSVLSLCLLSLPLFL